jgi:hypothetical protein
MRQTSVQRRKKLHEAETNTTNQDTISGPIKGTKIQTDVESQTNTEQPINQDNKVDSIIKAIELLQSIASDFDTIKFLIEQDLSDFSSGKKIQALKWETIKFITKLKEKLSHDSAADPSIKSKVAKWLGL